LPSDEINDGLGILVGPRCEVNGVVLKR
jgi:hypothetical protein